MTAQPQPALAATSMRDNSAASITPAATPAAAQLISVVIPTHNRAALLRRALTSVLRQTHQQFEVIIADDGSDEDIPAVLAELADHRLRYVRQHKSGACAARNLGARHARGQWLTFLDSDDEAQPDWLASLVHVLANEQAEIVCCGFEKVDEATGQTSTALPKEMGPVFNHAVGRFNAGTFALRTSVFNDLGGYHPDLPAWQQTELSLRLIPLAAEKNWRTQNIMRPLIRAHIHSGARIRTNPQAVYAGAKYALEHHADLLRKCRRTHADYHAVAGVNAAKAGHAATARHHFRQACKLQPLSLKAWGRIVRSYVPGN